MPELPWLTDSTQRAVPIKKKCKKESNIPTRQPCHVMITGLSGWYFMTCHRFTSFLFTLLEYQRDGQGPAAMASSNAHEESIHPVVDGDLC